MSVNDLLNNLNTNTHHKKIRHDPYVIQIGFDWGTSFSKCVFRDFSKNRAFVYSFKTNQKEDFLISSTILYFNNKFKLNQSSNQYPAQGLWNIKIALSDICNKNFSSHTLKRFNTLANLIPGSNEQIIFIKACAIFYLSRILQHIRLYIIKKYNDFGSHPNDDMYINLAIPVSDISNKKTSNTFKDILGKAWYIACKNKILGDSISRYDMEEIVKQKFPTDNLVFNVYPEVSANIQALRNSPYASINDTRIYVYTDVGSGTVDQCCFTFYSPNKSIDDSNNFFAAKVFPYGSSVIEFLCHNKWPKIGLNTWKQLKEECSNDIRLNTIINILESRLTSEFKNHTLLQLQDHLHDNYSINSKESMRRNIYVVFGGGGCTYLPYKSAVFKALQSYLGLPKDYLEKLSSSWTDRIIYLNIPEDIVLDSEHYNWMKRLYVAYGISFLYDDLPKFKSPNQLFLKKQFFRYSEQKSKNIIDKTINKEEKQICPYCRGQNPNCLYCDGKGVI